MRQAYERPSCPCSKRSDRHRGRERQVTVTCLLFFFLSFSIRTQQEIASMDWFGRASQNVKAWWPTQWNLLSIFSSWHCWSQDVFCIDFRIIDEQLGKEFRRSSVGVVQFFLLLQSVFVWDNPTIRHCRNLPSLGIDTDSTRPPSAGSGSWKLRSLEKKWGLIEMEGGVQWKLSSKTRLIYFLRFIQIHVV